VDEWVVQSLTEYDGKPLKSAEKGDLELEQNKQDQEEFNALFGFIKSKLEANVKEVKASSRLKDSVSCLTGDAQDMSAYMEKLLKASGQPVPEVKRVLEINLTHPLISKIKALFETDRDNPALKNYCELLFDLAVIAEGGKLENPSKFSRLVGEAVANAELP